MRPSLLLLTVLTLGCGSKGGEAGGASDACATARKSMAAAWDDAIAKVTARKMTDIDTSKAQNDAESVMRDASIAWRGTASAATAQTTAISGLKGFISAAEKLAGIQKQLLELGRSSAAEGTGDPAIKARLDEGEKLIKEVDADRAALVTFAAKLETDGAAAEKSCAAK
jgi:hypothetical protein